MVALGIISIFVICNYFLAITIAKFQKVRMRVVGERTNAISEVIDNIKLIKFYYWIDKFMDKANKSRNRELWILFKRLLLWVLNMCVFVVGYPVLACSVFISATFLFDMPISVPYAIAILQVMGSLQSSTRRLPFFIGQVVEFLIALDRIQMFLGVDEIEEGVIEHQEEDKIGVKIEENSFYWGFDRPAPPKRGKRKNRTKLIERNMEIQ